MKILELMRSNQQYELQKINYYAKVIKKFKEDLVRPWVLYKQRSPQIKS